MATSYIDNTEDKSWEALKDLTYPIKADFQVTLKDHDYVLFCHEALRLIPRKRLVIKGMWGGRSVVAKLFYERGRAEFHAKRDARGMRELALSGVSVPELLFQGTALDKRISVLIFENIEPALSLDDIWRLKNNIPEVTPLMSAMTLELATQHVLGVTQKDLHFKNFLIRKKHIYTLDGGDVDIIETPLSKKDSIDNLALFFAQLGVGTEDLQEKLFDIYTKSRSWIVKKQDRLHLKACLQKWQEKRWQHYQEKVMRECTAFVYQRGLTQVCLYDRQLAAPELLQALKNPEVAIAAQTSDILKEGRSSTVVQVMLDGRSLVLKRYNMKNAIHHLRRAFRPTRAIKNWRLAHLLRMVGVPVPKPVAVLEKQFLGLRGRSYYFCEFVDGVNAGEFFAHANLDNYMALSVAQEMIQVIENLAKLKMTHGDLKATNILISKQKPVLIDLDGMREHKTKLGLKYALQQDVERFMRNWAALPSIAKMFELLIEEMYRRLDF